VGRDAELQRLLTEAERARGGNPGAVILHGEPGVGKTRLLSEVATRVEVDGFRVLWGRCLRFSAESSSYLPLIQAFGPQVDLVATGDGAMVLQRVSAAVDAGLRAGPVALLIDDMQCPPD
jgi:predicted ATPase